MAYIFDLSDAWTGGAAFTAIKMNVSDGGSTAGSLLMDLQVGGVSQSRVNKNGQGYLRGLNDFNPDLTLGPTASVGIGQYTNNGFFVRVAGDTALFVYNSGGDKRFNIGAGYHLGIGGSNTSEPDLKLFRDAANTLAQRNGVNAQAFNLYKTYTDAANYERGFVKFSGGVFRVGTEKAGTGVATNSILVADNIPCFQWGGFGGGFATMNVSLASAAAGTYDLGAGAIGGAFRRLHLAQFVETSEMTAPAAPAANGVRIYAEDNGSGKTRLMALFATGVAQQIAIEP